MEREVEERELTRWKLIEDFRQCLERQKPPQGWGGTWKDARRRCQLSDYLSLFLLGLFNPVVRTMRAVCAASHLKRVQEDICTHAISLGSFSEAQRLVEPAWLETVFSDLSQQVLARCPERPLGSGNRRWLIQDGSLFAALPRMHWALWRHQGKPQAQVRLHLSLEAQSQAPLRATVTEGKICERKVWKEQWRQGDAYIADRYYGENYQCFKELEEKGAAFVIRLRDEAVVQVSEELPLSAADQAVRVVRSARGKLGSRPSYESIELHVVWVQTEKEVLRLVTNLPIAELSAAEVALLYKERWRIELFFRWVKCILGCRHWLAHSPQGVALELYLALIAALLLQLYTGQRPQRRMMELLHLYTMGVASLAELEAALAQARIHQEQRTRKISS